MSNERFKSYKIGGISGLTELLLIHPIEYYKTVKQHNEKYISTSFIDFLKERYRNNGIKGLYKGFVPRILGIVPMRTVFWGTLYQSDKYLSDILSEKKLVYVLSGCIAGSVQTIIDCPIESLKTKNMTSNISIVKNFNFNGFTPNILRNMGFAAIFNYQKNTMKNNLVKEENVKLTFFENLYVGCISGFLASFTTQPLDYLKTKMQEKNASNLKLKEVFLNTAKKNPLLFFSGTMPRVSISCISMAVGLSIFELFF